MSFMQDLPPWIFDKATWEVGFVEGSTPTPKAKGLDTKTDAPDPIAAPKSVQSAK
ncbi:MAG: hypothetical protein AAFZ91_00155 [Pseudomonadota bacterium]